MSTPDAELGPHASPLPPTFLEVAPGLGIPTAVLPWDPGLRAPLPAWPPPGLDRFPALRTWSCPLAYPRLHCGPALAAHASFFSRWGPRSYLLVCLLFGRFHGIFSSFLWALQRFKEHSPSKVSCHGSGVSLWASMVRIQKLRPLQRCSLSPQTGAVSRASRCWWLCCDPLEGWPRVTSYLPPHQMARLLCFSSSRASFRKLCRPHLAAGHSAGTWRCGRTRSPSALLLLLSPRRQGQAH